MSNKTVTFPGQMVQVIADRLGDLDWNLPVDEAADIAREMVIDVTLAVDSLRASEAKGA
jgi:hypothetical protein